MSIIEEKLIIYLYLNKGINEMYSQSARWQHVHYLLHTTIL